MKEKIETKDPKIGNKTIRFKDYEIVHRNLLARKTDFGGHTLLSTPQRNNCTFHLRTARKWEDLLPHSQL